jgi:ankyrin repeat protein
LFIPTFSFDEALVFALDKSSQNITFNCQFVQILLVYETPFKNFSEKYMHKKNPHDPIQEIRNQNVLVKMIESQPGDDQHWHFLLNQLADPQNVRPARRLNKNQDDSLTWNAATSRWTYRKPSTKRDAPQNARYTKKTPTTLVPPDGKMRYFDQDSLESVGIGFVITKNLERKLVNIKDKFIFSTNIRSKDSPWIYDKTKYNNTKASPKLKSTTLDAIREYHRNCIKENIIPEWNEIIASPSAEAVAFLQVSKDRLFCRINMLSKQLLVQKKLGIKLPLLIMGGDTEIKEYTLIKQLEDITEVHNRLTVGTTSYKKTVAKDRIYGMKLNNLINQVDYGQLIPKNFDASDQKLNDAIATLLLTLYQQGKKKEAITLLRSIPSPIQANNLNKVLHEAVKSNDNKIIALLLAKGASVNYKDSRGATPLAIAVGRNNQTIFTEFMKLDASKFEKQNLQSALLNASALKSESACLFFSNQLLTKQEFTPTRWMWTDSEETALHAVTKKKYHTVAKLMCEHNGDVESKAKKITPIDLAFKNQDYKMVCVLLENSNLEPKKLGTYVIKLLRHKQYESAKKILNLKNVKFEDYGSDFKDVIQNIAADKTLNDRAKQTIALSFIQHSFNSATSTMGMMHLVELLLTCTPEAKAFLYQPTLSVTSLFHYWNDQRVCSFWSAIMKLSKNRLLEIIQSNPELEITPDVSAFLDTRRISWGSSDTTTSSLILKEKDGEKRDALLAHEKIKLIRELRNDYGFVYK